MQEILISLTDILLTIVSFVIVIAFIFNVWISYGYKKLAFDFLPTPEELAKALMVELIGNRKVFEKFILPVIGLDAKAEKDIASAIIGDSPIMIALEAIQPQLADRIKHNPRLLLQLPTAVARINPKWGELLSTVIGSQFNVLGMLATGNLSVDEAKAIQDEVTQAAALEAQGYTKPQIAKIIAEHKKVSEQKKKDLEPIPQPQNTEPINTPAPNT